MLSVMNRLTDDPKWTQLTRDELFLENWRSQMIGQHAKLSHQMLDWVRPYRKTCNPD